MDSLTASTQIEGLDSLLPLLEEARHEEALPLIDGRLAKQPDVPLWKYLKALVSAGKGLGVEAATLLNEVANKPGFATGFGLPPDVNTLVKTSALNHLLFETSVEPTNLEPWASLERVASLLDAEGFKTKAIMGRWKARPEDEAMPRKFEQHFEQKDLDDKIRIIENLLEDHPDSCLPRACLGHYMQEKGKTALAIRHLKKALDTNAKAWQPHLYLGRVFFSQGRFEDAENRFSEAVELREESNAELLSAIAACQKATYRYDEALESYFKALDEYPADFTSWDELEELSNAMGAAERLVQTVKKVAIQDPTNLSLAARVVNLALNSNDPLEAKRLVEGSGIVKEPGKSAEMTKLAARMFETLGEGDKAAKLHEILLQNKPDDVELRIAYGLSLLKAQRAAEAEEVLKETAKQHPYDKNVQLAWGRSLLALNQAENAQRSFTAAARMAAGDPEPLTQQGRALVALGKYDEAMAVLKESTKIAAQQTTENLVALGMVYEKKRVLDIAKDFFRQALTMDAGNRQAAQGWLRMFRGQAGQFKEEAKTLFNERGNAFGLAQLYQNLLLASLHEGCPDQARTLHQDLQKPVKAGMKSEEYAAFLDKSLVKSLPILARELEQQGKLENAREVWRFAVTSNQPELSDKATTELLRLDTVEAAMSEEEKAKAQPETEPDALPATSLEPLAGGEDGDPLLSLLSTTLPEGEEVPLFESPSAMSPEPSSVSEESPLFATGVSDLSSAAEAVTQAAAAEPAQPSPAPVSPASPEPAASTPESPVAVPEPPAETTPPEVVTPAPPEAAVPLAPPVAVAPAAPAETAVPSSPPAEEQAIAPPAPSEAPTTSVPVPPTPPSEAPTQAISLPPVAPAAPVAVEPEPAAVTPAPISQPEAAAPEPSAPAAAPAETSEAAPVAQPQASPAPAATLEEERKDLLPIPMAVDFEPQTRRQLHFHEALIQNHGGVLSPESIAHLMVCSSLGSEPPDPSSDDGTSISELQSALLDSARVLSENCQYRGATRVLKTALLYAPEADELQAELIKVSAEWADWLVGSQEFAHAVSLVRIALHRRPDSAELAEQLESIYQAWMDWSDEKGDTAARDLLAVYLQQEQASLQSFRETWKERAAQRAAVAAQAQAQPRVEPNMPAPTPQAKPVSPAAPQAAAAPTTEEPAPAAPAATAAQTEAPAQPEAPAAPEPPAEEAPQEAAPVETAPAEAAPAAPAAVEAAAAPQTSEPPAAPEAPAEPPAAEPPTVEETAAAPAEPPAKAPAPAPTPAAPAGFTNSDQAIAALDANPTDESLSSAVFEFHKDNMRTLTTVLRDRVSSNDEPIWLLLLARAFRQGGSETMAVIQYQKYIKASPSPEAYEELAQTYEEIGKEDFAKMTRRKAERAFS